MYFFSFSFMKHYYIKIYVREINGRILNPQMNISHTYLNLLKFNIFIPVINKPKLEWIASREYNETEMWKYIKVLRPIFNSESWKLICLDKFRDIFKKFYFLNTKIRFKNNLVNNCLTSYFVKEDEFKKFIEIK